MERVEIIYCPRVLVSTLRGRFDYVMLRFLQVPMNIIIYLCDSTTLMNTIITTPSLNFELSQFVKLVKCFIESWQSLCQ